MNYPWRSYNALPISNLSFYVSLGLSQGWDNIVLMTQSKVGWVKAILYEKLLRTLQCPNSMEIITTSLGRKHCMCLRRWEFENATLDFYALPASESVQGFPMVVVDTFFFSLCLDVTDSRTHWNISVLCHENGPPCWGVGRVLGCWRVFYTCFFCVNVGINVLFNLVMTTYWAAATNCWVWRHFNLT